MTNKGTCSSGTSVNPTRMNSITSEIFCISALWEMWQAPRITKKKKGKKFYSELNMWFLSMIKFSYSQCSILSSVKETTLDFGLKSVKYIHYLGVEKMETFNSLLLIGVPIKFMAYLSFLVNGNSYFSNPQRTCYFQTNLSKNT